MGRLILFPGIAHIIVLAKMIEVNVRERLDIFMGMFLSTHTQPNSPA
jgi:hypothetical protein